MWVGTYNEEEITYLPAYQIRTRNEFLFLLGIVSGASAPPGPHYSSGSVKHRKRNVGVTQHARQKLSLPVYEPQSPSLAIHCAYLWLWADDGAKIVHVDVCPTFAHSYLLLSESSSAWDVSESMPPTST